ncbi:MBL fold metallo-hydrolase [Helicovermis profundi]|uniref:Metallo-hydrolase/oxidoreductase n=1 Tax=Helicovermis profundi TaxID=3065157 RepID=A0AAU9E9C6_9FIRM|nr:metallo-hydrolase/oxidoreductase [Clostridia bacterium S502]
MKFEIIGSGGCVSLPKPLCECKICREARLKGRPYSRFGCSLFLHDINLLVDTPEDICHAINMSTIKEIENVLFSHTDPDHVLGFRVFEQLRLNWFGISEGKECENPISVFAMDHVLEDLNEIKSKHGRYFDYYELVRNLIKCESVSESINIDNIKISFVRIESATVFVFEEGHKKVIYAPCDVKPFPKSDLFNNADILIIGNTIVGETLKNGYILSDDSFLKKDLFSMDEIVGLKKKFNIDKVIVTHLEEDWGKSFDDYKELESKYENIEFAFDGMKILV